METIVEWNAGMSSACVCWAATKMIRLPCLCVQRNMNVITPPYPISRVVVCTCDRGFRWCVHVTAVLRVHVTAPVCTCDRGIAGVYMWPPFRVRRWPYGSKKVSACTCDLDLRARMTPWPSRVCGHTVRNASCSASSIGGRTKQCRSLSKVSPAVGRTPKRSPSTAVAMSNFVNASGARCSRAETVLLKKRFASTMKLNKKNADARKRKNQRSLA